MKIKWGIQFWQIGNNKEPKKRNKVTFWKYNLARPK
jgi:hypothetical protein